MRSWYMIRSRQGRHARSGHKKSIQQEVDPEGALLMLDVVKQVAPSIPFDADRLDRLMDEAGIDVLVVTSKHNVQYLLGGHRAFFFESMDAMGLSRYLPVLVYPKGGRQKAGYFGHRMEGFQKENHPFWVSESQTNSSGTLDAMQKAIDYIRKLGVKPRRIGAELGFLPVDAGAALRSAFSGSELVDALFVLERLRAVKSPEELRQLRIASESVIESMLAVIAHHGPGATKRELTEALRREETDRGLVFDYCLITAGSSLNRAPSDQKWNKGDILSLDSGGNYHGYIGDLCRMAIHGDPDPELEDLLGEIEQIQRAAMKPIKAGIAGGAIYAAAVPRQGELAASCCAGYPTLTIGSSPQQAWEARTAPWKRVCARRDDGGRSELRSSRIADLDAHREQCHRADTDDKDQQSDRVVV